MDHEINLDDEKANVRCRALGATIETNSQGLRRFSYVIGTSRRGDEHAFALSGFMIPIGWTIDIRDRKETKYSRDDIYFFNPGRKLVFRSKLSLRKHLQELSDQT